MLRTLPLPSTSLIAPRSASRPSLADMFPPSCLRRRSRCCDAACGVRCGRTHAVVTGLQEDHSFEARRARDGESAFELGRLVGRPIL